MKIKMSLLVVSVGLILTAAACDPGGTSNNAAGAAAKSDASKVGTQQAQYQQSQPVPFFSRSQLRQNLIEVETAQAKSTATTTFFFNQGIQNPVFVCPSIGFPIPATYQLTAPDGPINSNSWGHDWHDLLPLAEATGVFTGQTSGTFAICVGGDGKAFAKYFEGFVDTVTGPAHWDKATGTEVMDGTSSAEFSTK